MALSSLLHPFFMGNEEKITFQLSSKAPILPAFQLSPKAPILQTFQLSSKVPILQL